MSRPLEAVLNDLAALKMQEFDSNKPTSRGFEQLHELCDELSALDDPDSSVPAMFNVMERLDCAELGAPGPLVHTMEQWRGRYEKHLVNSVRRRPSIHAIWMINRILNVSPPDTKDWIDLLAAVASHPLACQSVKDQAVRFIQIQSERHRG